MALNKLTPEMAQTSDPTPYIISMVGELAQTLLLAWLFIRLGVKSAMEGLGYGALLAGGFGAISYFITYGYEMRSLHLAIIDGGVWVLTFGIIGAVLGAWRK